MLERCWCCKDWDLGGRCIGLCRRKASIRLLRPAQNTDRYVFAATGYVFTQDWQTDSPRAHRCYSRKLCKKWRHWEKLSPWTLFSTKIPPTACSDLCPFSPFFPLSSLCPSVFTDFFLSLKAIKCISTNYESHSLLIYSQTHIFSHQRSCTHSIGRAAYMNRRVFVFLPHVTSFECLLRRFCVFFFFLNEWMQKHQMKLTPIFIALQFGARLLLSNAETPLCEITVQFWKVETGSRQFRRSASATMDRWPWRRLL